MAEHRLAALNGSNVAVEIVQSGQRRMLRGTATYRLDPGVGRHLQINVREVWGEFDFILREDEWDGEILPGGASGCDYQICLSTACVCAK